MEIGQRMRRIRNTYAARVVWEARRRGRVRPTLDEAKAEFDRILADHDAEVRALAAGGGR